MRVNFRNRIIAAAAIWLVALTLLGFWPSAATSSPAAAQGTNVGFLAPNGMRGVSFVHTTTAPFGSDASFTSLRALHDTGATWVSIVATFRQENAHASTFYRSDQDPTDANIAQVVAYARSLGMRIMLQPVVLSERDGVWNGLLSPDNIGVWFTNYSKMIQGYATLAQQMKIDVLCVGTEFFSLTTPPYSNYWRTVVADARHIYFGLLTYSANWGDKKNPEYATIDWWDTLDYIGVSAYFPLSWNNFTTEPLRAGWFGYRDPFGANAIGEEFHWFDMLNAAHLKWNKPLLFTKIGFGSYANSPGRWDVRPDQYRELTVQASAYEATMEAWSTADWMQGIFWSPWYSDPDAGGPLDVGESPQNKPAATILSTWYHK